MMLESKGISIATGLRQPAGFNYVGEGWSVWSLVFSAGFFLVFSPTGCFGSLLRLGVFVPVFLLLLFALLCIGAVGWVLSGCFVS